MRHFLIAAASVLMLTAAGTGIASAHQAPPCNDSGGDGSPSGQEYAHHHIVPMAQSGQLGHDGHKPGTHHGFSTCKE